eukprot:49223-Chlamydomonas_euryale.AAC.6
MALTVATAMVATVPPCPSPARRSCSRHCRHHFLPAAVFPLPLLSPRCRFSPAAAFPLPPRLHRRSDVDSVSAVTVGATVRLDGCCCASPPNGT